MYVFEATLPGVAAGGFVQREEPLPAFAWRAGARIEQKIRFGGEAQSEWNGTVARLPDAFLKIM